jgi:SSS family solute:Na+ symporter
VLVAAAVFVLPAARAADVAAALRGSDLLAPAGAAGFFTPRVWLSFLLMNAMAIIAYPQMFQRFFAAEDERAFRALLGWWPVMAAVAAVVPVALGLVGTQLVPGLSTPDLVIPELLAETAPTWVLGLVVGGAVAAMMSTADSLVLTLSSMVTRDVYRDHLAGDDDGDESAAWATEIRVSRASTAALLGGGFLLALVATGRAPGIAAVGTIVELAVYFIQGNALLLPVFLAALYWPAATRTGAVASVLLGQGYFLAGVFGPAPAFGFTPFVPALALAVAGLVAGSLLGPAAARSAPGAGADTRGGD